MEWWIVVRDKSKKIIRTGLFMGDLHKAKQDALHNTAEGSYVSGYLPEDTEAYVADEIQREIER